jgi:CheY-like chemotaxis protein
LADPHSAPTTELKSERLRSDVCIRPPLERHAGVGRKVLVVDDEPLMRLFVVRALRGAGYEPVEADSAARALELLESAGAEISLLLSDVQLPGISGSELVERARQLVPSLPTLLMSGSAKPWLVNEQLMRREADLLQKPFRIAELLGKLEQLLPQ